MEITKYNPKYKQDFIKFNTQWITEYFGKLEEHDIEAFNSIDKDLENGAMIYFALNGNTLLAGCMVVPSGDNVWEVCKLCSNKNVDHKGAGTKVFEASVNYALEKGAKKLIIITNKILEPAIHIYKKFGFQEVKLDNYVYKRGNIAFEYLINND